MPESASAKRPRDFVQAVVHVMDVLRSFGTEMPQMTLSDVSRKTGLDRAGARRYLLTLAYLGYVVQTGKLFRLSPKVLDLGFSFIASIPMAGVAQSYLTELSQQTGETFGLAIMDGEDVVHIARSVPKRKVVTVAIGLGERLPALAASSGRVLIALKPAKEREQIIEKAVLTSAVWRGVTTKGQLRTELARVFKRGYAVNDPELEVGLRAIAVPVLNSRDIPVAALCVVAPMSSVSKSQLTTKFLPLMKRAVAEIQAALVEA